MSFSFFPYSPDRDLLFFLNGMSEPTAIRIIKANDSQRTAWICPMTTLQFKNRKRHERAKAATWKTEKV